MKRDLHKEFNIQKNDGLKVPENYFSALEEEVMQSIGVEQKTIVRRWWPNLIPVAASLTLLILCLNYFYTQPDMVDAVDLDQEVAAVSLEDLTVDEYFSELSTLEVDLDDHIIIDN